MEKTGVRFYRLTFSEAAEQGSKILFYWIFKKLLRLGTYGHVSIIVENLEYTVAENGLECYESRLGDNYSNDVIWTKYDAISILENIQKWDTITGSPPVTIESLAKALARPNCYSSYGCCTLFVSYALTIPPTTLADELCHKILSSSHIKVTTPSQQPRAVATVSSRRLQLSIIRSLYYAYCRASSIRWCKNLRSFSKLLDI